MFWQIILQIHAGLELSSIWQVRLPSKCVSSHQQTMTHSLILLQSHSHYNHCSLKISLLLLEEL